MKKVLMIFLSIALIFTMAAPTFAADNVNDKFAELKAAGVLDGDANGNMLPAGEEMERQQLAKIANTLVGNAGTPNVDIPAFADDYKTGVWGFEQGWIQAAYTNGLMLGKGDAGFDARGTVTWAELLTVVLRAADLDGNLDNDNWKASAVAVAQAEGFISAPVDPDNVATYGDLVNQVYNSYEAIEASKTFQVSSVTSANGKEAKIVFNKAVDSTTVLAAPAPANVLTNVTFTAIGTAPAITPATTLATLSADGKTLTIVPAGAEVFNGSYAVTVTNLVKDTGGNAAVPYSAIADLTDNVRPAVASVTYPTNDVVRVTFTEPMNLANAAAVEAALTIRNIVGGFDVAKTGRVTLAADKKSFDIDASMVVGPPPAGMWIAALPHTGTLVGIADYAGNLISPNPATFNMVRQDVDTTKPSIVNIESAGIGVAKITYSEKLSNYGTINGEPITIGTNATVDSTGTVVTVTTGTIAPNASPALNGVTMVTLAGFTDLSGNVGPLGGTSAAKLVNFVADTTAPKYVSHEIATIGTDRYLLVKYDENVKLGAPGTALTGTYVDANQITKAMTPIAIADASQHPILPAITDTIKIKITSLVPGTYNVTTTAGLAEDLAPASNPSAAKQLEFTISGFVDPTVPVATIGAVQTVEDQVVVTFNKEVTAATALNTTNYKVEGVNVFESAIFFGDAKTVHLKLAPNTITVDGDRMFNISNVQTAAGKTMVAVNAVQLFKENVKPVLASAKLTTATTITAKFSEAIANTGSANAFEVYKDGVKLTGVTAAAPNGTDSVVITVPTISLSSVYTVKYIGTDFVDIPSVAPVTAPNTAITGTIVTATN